MQTFDYTFVEIEEIEDLFFSDGFFFSGYFVVDGRLFCEVHAKQIAQPPGPNMKAVPVYRWEKKEEWQYWDANITIFIHVAPDTLYWSETRVVLLHKFTICELYTPLLDPVPYAWTVYAWFYLLILKSICWSAQVSSICLNY